MVKGKNVQRGDTPPVAEPSEGRQGKKAKGSRSSSGPMSWTFDPRFEHGEPIPSYPLGGIVDGIPLADPNRRINWAEVFAIPPQNPCLRRRAFELGLLPVAPVKPKPARRKKGNPSIKRQK